MARIKGTTTLFGLIGSDIKRSKSPEIHNLAFEELNLDNVYLTLETQPDKLSSVIEALKQFGVKGFNVTMPLKEIIIPFLDDISPDAKIIGSVNTVLNDNGKLIGYNYDGMGYVIALKVNENIKLIGKKAMLIGAGGAAKSVAVELAKEVSELIVVNRTTNRANELVDRIRQYFPNCTCRSIVMDNDLITGELENTDLLVDATPVGTGLSEHQSVLQNFEGFHPGLHVSNLVYSPDKTELLLKAERHGCKVSNGLGMLIYQAELGFKLWTNRDMPIKKIKNYLLANK